ncbi:hypothetical protein Cal6303_5584 [Calothrix sp. PCC 6303]|nr:hypothetical protein Cal6303_5584 [Calothrix sp. PCC 6303]
MSDVRIITSESVSCIRMIAGSPGYNSSGAHVIKLPLGLDLLKLILGVVVVVIITRQARL